jgi:hypothetical protein
MIIRKKSIPRVEFRRALADWGMGRVHGDEVVALARVMPIHWGGRCRLLRETNLESYRARGYQEADRAFRLHSDAYDRIVRERGLGDPWFVSFAAEDRSEKDTPISSTLAMRTYGTTGRLTMARTFARVRSWLDVVALRLADPDVDHALREEHESGPRVGCSAFDPRVHADRPWPCSVLMADPTLGGHFRGQRGDLVEAWLVEVYSHGNRHGMALARALCGANLETSWGTVDAPMQALEKAGWIRRGLLEPTWEHHFIHGHEAGAAEVWMREEPSASALGLSNYWKSGKPHPTACSWFSTGCPEALEFLASRSK